jgi:hypothetical protein
MDRKNTIIYEMINCTGRTSDACYVVIYSSNIQMYRSRKISTIDLYAIIGKFCNECQEKERL